TTNPLEAGLDRFVDFKGGDFMGRRALEVVAEKGPARRLIGFKTSERDTVPRHDHPIKESGRLVGKVTSGNYSPTLGANIGLGYVPSSLAHAGQHLAVDVRGKDVSVEVTPLPFYRRGQV
ncbi:MAG: glycine cleavage system protein, partial [Dehalococcoidia bacterium]|nr:glycine cleavage system protein [Dehalococcoidia bacterium]